MKKFLLTMLGVFGLASGAAAQATGTPEAPLTVEQFIEQGVPAAAVPDTYVTGYIVGFVPGQYLSDAVFDSTEGAVATNILLGGSSSEDDVAYCIPVQLPAGDVRAAINLSANPGNLGRQVTLCGSHEKYFGANGLKSVSAYAFDGKTIEGGSSTPAGPVTSLNEDFATIPSDWSNIGSKPFYSTSFQDVTYAAMTGYKGTAPFDQWLISPAIDIEKCAEKVLTFDSQVNGYGATTTSFKAYVLTSNDPATATKTELTCTWATAPESGYSGWVSSGDIDLSAYKGQIYIGFNYVATEDANYATWCLTKVRLNASGTPVVPPTSGYIYEGLVNNADDFTIDNGTLPAELSYVWAWDDRYGLKASAYVNGAGYVSDAWAISPVVDLTGCTDVTVSLSQAANFFKGTLSEQTFFGVREVGGQWAPIDLPNVPESDSWTFVESGEASLAAYEGKKVEFGFNYKSDGTVCGTWEIKDLKVSGNTGSGIVNILDAMSVRVNGRSIQAPAGAKVYTLNGMESGTDNLTPGLYIVRTAGKAVKVIVK